MPSRSTAALIVLLGLILALNEARGQHSLQEEYPVRAIAVTAVEAEIGMEYNYFGETIRRKGSGRTRFSNHYFQQYLLGRTWGYVYHPDFIDFNAELKGGMSQQWLNHSNPLDGSRSSNDVTSLLGYRFRADILRRKAVSGTVTASREERILMGLFLDRHRTITDTYSATVRWRMENLRMDLTGRRTETEEFAFRSYGTTTSNMILYNLRHEIGRRTRTDVRYRFQAYERSFTARTLRGDVERETELDTHDLSITNRTILDPDEKVTLRSTFRFHDREGTQDLRTYYLEEMLRYDAYRAFRPYLRGSARRNEFNTRTTTTYRGEAGFDGNLYESLGYHFDLHGTRTDFDSFTEDRYGFTGRVNYRKRTAAGILTAGYSRTIDQVKRRGVFQTVQIFGESLVARIATVTFLSEPNVIPASIRVTDTANQVVFQEGFDYEVIVRGNRTGIRVIPGGLLADGTRVLVDYTFQTDETESYIADDEAAHIRHDFPGVLDGLALYARRNAFRARNVKGGNDAAVFEHTTHAVGLRQDWSDFAFNTEYEWYDDDFGGYNRWRNQIEGNHGLWGQTRWGWNAGMVRTRYDTDFGGDRDNRERHYFAGTHILGSFARTGYWRLEGRVMHDTGRTERTVWGVVGRIGYQWRRLNMEGGARYEHLEFIDSKQERVQLFVGTRLNLGRRTFGRTAQ